MMISMFLNEDVMLQDHQWYVINGNSTVGGNCCSSLGQSLSIDGVRHPNVIEIPNAGNDFFVIYKDGNSYNYLNTRGMAMSSGSFPTGRRYCVVSPSNSSIIDYLYLTNKYEGDDWPPSSVTLNDIGNCSSMPSSAIQVSASSVLTGSQSILSFNHNVRPGRDLTAVIEIPDAFTTSGCRNLTVCYNINDYNSTPLLELEPVFETFSGSSYILPEANHVVNNNCITISESSSFFNQHDYLFLNFKCVVNVPEPMINENLRFTISASGNPCNIDIASSVSETVSHSHDPNFVKVLGICTNEVTGDQYVSYRVQFFNDGDTEATSLKVQNLEVPGILDPTCIKVLDWRAGYAAYNPSFNLIPHLDGSLLSFEFSENPQDNHKLAPYDPYSDNDLAYIEFCIKIREGINISDYSNSLHMGVPNTMFGLAAYPIYTFYDISCKKSAFPVLSDCERDIPKNYNCECSCEPYTIQRNCLLCRWFNWNCKKLIIPN